MSATQTVQQSKNSRTRGLSLPFVVGPLRGNWWQLASGGKITRLLLGTYEPEQSGLFRTHIRPGDQVLDIGASVGYYTLLSARLVGISGRVVSFEPDPNNLQFLRSHVEQNRLAQVTILPVALSDETGTARFGGGTGTGTGRLCQEGECEVAVRRLDDVAAEMDLRPQHLKVDVEGAEMAVLRGGQKLIEKHRPTIFLSTHNGIVPGVHRQCCELLTAWGYRLSPITGESLDNASELLCTR
jgi:FkbM family methyltransferase